MWSIFAESERDFEWIFIIDSIIWFSALCELKLSYTHHLTLLDSDFNWA